MHPRALSRITAPLLGAALVLSGLTGAPADAAVTQARATAIQAAPTAAPAAAPSTWQPRPDQYPATVTTKDLAITMSDGTTLRADLTLPADTTGAPVAGRFPVVVTITAYNKTVLGNGAGGTLAGADPTYLVKRGYAQLIVDARGTGSSEGTWNAFDTRENTDAGEVMTWAHAQPWSNGSTAMTGASYMGISQIFAAAAKPAGLKAIFPQVPGADVYRDVVASGGQVDAGFIPLWLGLVTATGLIPPATLATSPDAGLKFLADRLNTAGTFTGPTLVQAMAGQETAYDGPFYAERSPINVIGQVDVPTFLIGGEYDLFQRGTPMLFDALRRRGVPTKLILGPWDHLQGSSGAEVAQAGYGTLAELQLRWFDHYVSGHPDPTLDSDIAPLTYHEIGTGAWRTSDRWLGPDREAQTFRLSGGAVNAQPGLLTQGAAQPGTATVLPVPVAGLCTRSASQWTAGIPQTATGSFNPCLKDNQVNDALGVAFETAPLTTPLRFQGPLNARLYVSSPAGGGMVSVAVEDVAPDGTVDRITGGWQVLSLRELDLARSRYLDGHLIQAHHPFTAASEQPMKLGEVAPVDVEVFPTGASIEPGHRLRVAVQAFDTPHLLPTVPQLPGVLSPITIHNSAQHPSALTVPVLARVGAELGTPPRRAATHTTAHLRRASTKRGRTNRLRVQVGSATGVPRGGVVVRVDGRRVAQRRLRQGAAVVRVRAPRKPGRHLVAVRYLGGSAYARSGTRITWRVRR